MAERESLPEVDLWAWPGGDPDGEYAEWEKSFANTAARPGAVSDSTPRRTSRLLMLVIGLAAATLVVTTALLVTGNFSGEIPSQPGLRTWTSTPSPITTTATNPTTPISTSPAASTSPTVSSPAPTTEPSPEVAPAPVEPAPAAPPPASERTTSEGPRINVTRTPMSFTPAIRGN